MTKMEKKLNQLKERYDLNSQLINRSKEQRIFICNPTRKSIRHSVELNNRSYIGID